MWRARLPPHLIAGFAQAKEWTVSYPRYWDSCSAWVSIPEDRCFRQVQRADFSRTSCWEQARWDAEPGRFNIIIFGTLWNPFRSQAFSQDTLRLPSEAKRCFDCMDGKLWPQNASDIVPKSQTSCQAFRIMQELGLQPNEVGCMLDDPLYSRIAGLTWAPPWLHIRLSWLSLLPEASHLFTPRFDGWWLYFFTSLFCRLHFVRLVCSRFAILSPGHLYSFAAHGPWLMVDQVDQIMCCRP